MLHDHAAAPVGALLRRNRVAQLAVGARQRAPAANAAARRRQRGSVEVQRQPRPDSAACGPRRALRPACRRPPAAAARCRTPRAAPAHPSAAATCGRSGVTCARMRSAVARSGGSGSACGGGTSSSHSWLRRYAARNGQRLDRVLRRVEIGDAAGLQRVVDVLPVERAEPRSQHGLGDPRATAATACAASIAGVIGRVTCNASTASTCGSDSVAATAAASRAGGASARTSTGLARTISLGSSASSACTVSGIELGERDPGRHGGVRGKQSRVRVRWRRWRGGCRAESCPSPGCARRRTAACTCARARCRRAAARRRTPYPASARCRRRRPDSRVGSSERPAFSTTTGLMRAAARNADMNARASPTDST